MIIYQFVNPRQLKQAFVTTTAKMLLGYKTKHALRVTLA